MKKLTLLLGLLGVLLAACVPATRTLPPDTPIVYNAPYRALFDATLQELTAAYVPGFASRVSFAIARAERDTGLITAVRPEPVAVARFRYRFPGTNDHDEDDDDIDSLPYQLGVSLALPLAARPEQTTITVVVRPAGERASLIYSTQGPSGERSGLAERLMRQVVAGLDARFGVGSGGPQVEVREAP